MNLKTPKDKRIIVIYNPYIRKYYVHFIDHDYGEEGAFDDESEWQYIDHPIYKDQHLAIQLDYDEIDQIHDIRLEADISDDCSYFVFRTSRYETDTEVAKRLNYKKEQDAKKKEIEKLKNDPDYKTYTYLKEKFKTCL